MSGVVDISEYEHRRPAKSETGLRAIARGMVIAGGVFWMVAAFIGPYVYQDAGLLDSVRVAMWPFLAAAVMLVIGWTYERLAAELLLLGVAAVLVWGVLYAWDPGVWMLMVGVLMIPMILAATMFMLSAHIESKRVHREDLENVAVLRGIELPAASESSSSVN